MKWIKHDTDANQDDKLQNVLLDYGLEGYGLYWYCIELIAGKVDKENITFELKHDARIIAKNTGSTVKKTEEMMRYFVSVGLFENTSGIITCMKIAKRLDKSMTSNPVMRDIISNMKEETHDTVMTQSEEPMQDKIRLDETRLEDKKNNATLVLQSFEFYWKCWTECKKSVASKNTSSKSATETRFKKMFNAAYFNKNTEQQFREEINAMCKYARDGHKIEGFNPFTNMQTGKFLTNQGWK
jgi:hypothetical protein